MDPHIQLILDEIRGIRSDLSKFRQSLNQQIDRSEQTLCFRFGAMEAASPVFKPPVDELGALVFPASSDDLDDSWDRSSDPAAFRLDDPVTTDLSAHLLGGQAEQGPTLVVAAGAILVNAAFLDAVPSFGCVVTMAAGVDHIDLARAGDNDAASRAQGEVFSVDIADHAVWPLVGVPRRVAAADRYDRAGLGLTSTTMPTTVKPAPVITPPPTKCLTPVLNGNNDYRTNHMLHHIAESVEALKLFDEMSSYHLRSLTADHDAEHDATNDSSTSNNMETPAQNKPPQSFAILDTSTVELCSSTTTAAASVSTPISTPILDRPFLFKQEWSMAQFRKKQDMRSGIYLKDAEASEVCMYSSQSFPCCCALGVHHTHMNRRLRRNLWSLSMHFALASLANGVFLSPVTPPICSCIAAHRLDILPLPWPPDPCEMILMIVDSGVAAYSIYVLIVCQCMSKTGGGLSVWMIPMASRGQQVFDRGKYMAGDHPIMSMFDGAGQQHWSPLSQVGATIYQSTARFLYGHEVILPKPPWLFLDGHTLFMLECGAVRCNAKLMVSTITGMLRFLDGVITNTWGKHLETEPPDKNLKLHVTIRYTQELQKYEIQFSWLSLGIQQLQVQFSCLLTVTAQLNLATHMDVEQTSNAFVLLMLIEALLGRIPLIHGSARQPAQIQFGVPSVPSHTKDITGAMAADTNLNSAVLSIITLTPMMLLSKTHHLPWDPGGSALVCALFSGSVMFSFIFIAHPDRGQLQRHWTSLQSGLGASRFSRRGECQVTSSYTDLDIGWTGPLWAAALGEPRTWLSRSTRWGSATCERHRTQYSESYLLPPLVSLFFLQFSMYPPLST